MLHLLKRNKVVDQLDRGGNEFFVEAMEPRVLLSADALGIDAGVLNRDEFEQTTWDQTTLPDWSDFPPADLDNSPEQNERLTVPEPLEPAVFAHLTANTTDSCDCLDAVNLVPLSADAETIDARHEIVFLDAGVADGETLLAELVGRDDTDITQVYMLDPNVDGIEQITRVLAGTQDIDAIHIVSHGSPGSLQLGNSVLNTAHLADYGEALGAWGQSLAADADILFYGCDLAADAQGQALVEAIGSLTGADVAASIDLTGDAEQGGDWDLEYRIGSVDAAVAFNLDVQRAYYDTLAIATFQQGIAGYSDTQDTYIDSSDAASSFGSSDDLAIVNGGDDRQALVRFDNIFVSQGGLVPDGASINSASLTLDVSGTNSSANISIHRILVDGNWNEGSTWNSLGNGIQLDDFEAVSSADDVVNGNDDPAVFDVTDSLNQWSSGGVGNYGWVLNSNHSSDWKGTSSEKSTLSARPRLTVDYTPADTTSGLVVHLEFEEGSGTIAADSTSNNNDALLDPSAEQDWTTGAIGGAFHFDFSAGDEDFFEIPDSASVRDVQEGSFTLAAWFNPDDIPTAPDDLSYGIIAKEGNHTGLWYNSNQKFHFEHTLSGPSWPNFGTTNSFAPGSFYHVAVTVDRPTGAMALYVNGQLEGTHSFTPGAAAYEYGGETWKVGTVRDTFGGSIDFPAKGIIDDVRIYDRALSGADVSELYSLGNAAPTATNLTSTSTYSEGAASVALDDIVVTDIDAGETITATLTLNNTGAGSLTTGAFGAATSTYSAGTGVWNVTGTVADVNAALADVAFVPATDNDVDTTITTHIEDAAGAGPADGTITLDVTPINDAPVIVNNGALDVPEEATRTITTAELQATDVDNTPSEIVYTITALPSGGTVQLDGSVLGISDTFTQDDIDNNRVTYSDSDNGETTSFQFTVGDGTYTSGNLTFSINGQPINDAPVVVAPGSALTATEQVGLAVEGRGFSVTDVDEAGGGAVATLSVGEGGISVVSGDSGVLITGGNGTGSVSLSGTIAQINDLLTGSGTGTITYLNNSDTPGASTVLSVTVNDQGNFGSDPGLSGDGSSEEGTNNVTINITPQNDEQVLATNTGTTVAEGSTGTIITNTLLAATDVDNTAAQLVYTVTVIPSNGTLYLNGVALGPSDTFTQDDIDSNLITYDHDGSETTSDSFGFSVDDGAGTASTGTFTITIIPVNDNDPVADDESFTVAEGGTATEADLVVGSSLLDGDTDADLPNDALTVNTAPVSGPNHGSLTLNADGTFSYTHDGSENFSDSFTYELLDADGGVTDIGTVTITITAQNDAPTLVNPIPDQVATENLPFGFQFAAGSFNDVDTGDSLSYSARQVDGTPLPGWLNFDAVTRTFTGTPINGDVTTTIEVTAQDISGATVSTTFDLVVDNINDAPILGNNNLTLNSGDTVVLTSGMLSAGDVDNAHGGLLFAVSDVSGGQFEFVNAPGIPVTSFNQAQLTAGNVVFVDDGDAVAPSYSVTVSDGTDSLGPVAATVNFTLPAPVVTTAPLIPPVPDGSAVTVPPATPTSSDVSVPESDSAEAEEPLDTSEADEPGPEDDTVTEDVLDAPADGSGDVDSYATDPVITDSDIDAPINSAQNLLKSFVARPPILAAMAIPSAIPEAFQLDALAAEIRAVLESVEFNDSLDRVRDDVSHATLIYQSLVGSGVAVTTGLSVGYVAWLVRGGVLLTTALSSLPAWQFVDPLPVLAKTQDKPSADDPESGADDSLESIIKEQSSEVASQTAHYNAKLHSGSVADPVEKRS